MMKAVFSASRTPIAESLGTRTTICLDIRGAVLAQN